MQEEEKTIEVTTDDVKETEVPPKKFNFWKLLLKISFTGIAFYLIYLKIDFVKLGQTLASANYFVLVTALLVYHASQIFSAFRLNIVLPVSQIHIPRKENLLLYYIGMFYNLFLPGGVGGDGYKVHLFKKYLKVPIKTSAGTVLYDRFSGLAALSFLIAITATFLIKDYQWVAIAAMPLSWVGFYAFTLLFFKKFKSLVFKVGLYSLLIQTTQLACAFLILWGIGVRENHIPFLLVFMISSVVSILPIFVGGAGARELTFIYIFDLMGMDNQQETAIALSLIFFAVSAINALPGIFVNERKLFRNIS